ncbi:MAG: hypothetical protein IKN97_11235 [Lachnospiraceae bacterium]|jgi:hypothetical protein|nr:hypothetical protein [Lachnospiraceae bacterium]
MAGIEIAQIPASIEYANIKHNEDMHSSLVQSQALVEGARKNELSHSQVGGAEKSEMRTDDKGNGSSGGYAGDGGENRRREHEEKNTDRVVVKGSSSSFDIKI